MALMMSEYMCESYIGKPIGTRTVPQYMLRTYVKDIAWLGSTSKLAGDFDRNLGISDL